MSRKISSADSIVPKIPNIPIIPKIPEALSLRRYRPLESLLKPSRWADEAQVCYP